MLFPQSFIRVWFFWESRLQHKCTWWLQVLWKFWNFMKFYENRNFWNFLKILKSYEIFYKISKFSYYFKIFQKFSKFHKFLFFFLFLKFWKKKSEFLHSDDNARGSRITITVVYPISNIQLKIQRKLFKLPVNSSAAVNSLKNYGPVNSLSVKNVKQ
jgi:hypothetical protein